MVTVVPPVVGPVLGLIPVTTGTGGAGVGVGGMGVGVDAFSTYTFVPPLAYIVFPPLVPTHCATTISVPTGRLEVAHVAVPFVFETVFTQRICPSNSNFTVPEVSGRLLIVSLTVAVKVVVSPDEICTGLATTDTVAGSARTWTLVVAELDV
jgi:hypothetical protein